MRSPYIKILTLSGLILVALFLFADTAEASECQTEEALKLGFLEGDWKVDSRFRIGGDPERWETSVGNASIEALFPGCLWREEFTGSRDGKVLRMTGLFAFSNISNRLQHVWAHSQHGLLTYYEGATDGPSINFESGFDLRGTRVMVRKVITKRSAGFEVRTERSLDGGRTWDVNWVLVYLPSDAPDSRE